MENIESGVQPIHEGASAEGTVQEDQSPVERNQTQAEPVRSGGDAEERTEQPHVSQPPRVEGSAVSEDVPNEPAGLTAEELQRLPPELRPGPDGRPPKITPRLLKQMRGHYFTVKHVTLENCGHKLDMINQPKLNCENCWYQWFNTHPQLVETADQFFRVHGKGPLVGMRGEKFFKMFVRYMATVIHFMKEEEAAKKAQEQANVPRSEEHGTFVGGNDWGPTPEEREIAASVIGAIEG